ncbi:uncharacterized protein LOC124354187 [Homalodisca vitripennis]|uniref:uncharacterized protein LOC124354187 n=1 Tax=Homalodisca vitripennis TaxID=197043 RepID=UPI001EEBE033|nr:uncharacterized protein LOC124354187 [Homalodisca vitripennis]KAG8309356.1 hypothetical protein J6590_087934 [Homalodisca vitripennis]
MDSRVIFLAILFVASATAAPSALLATGVAYAPGVVTASSSQVIARNYNGVAPIVPSAPYVAAPYVASAAAPYFAAAPYTAPYVAAPYAASYVL